ncbi:MULTISPECIES: hypothetical protein [Nonomuraea]|uniref:Uncharacterized protein n=1 Tax=Nonomuraea mangrovi TaxID=2316207 RepID=A0ABW4TFF4_9ACTN
MEQRRWDNDDRFTGVSDGSAMRPAVEDLAAVMARDGWVTEDPDAHLLPHLRAAPGWQVVAERLTEDGVYEVAARPDESLEGIDVHRAAIRLLSVIAEPSFFVRQSGPGTFECVTGVMPGDPPGYATHGHLVRLLISEWPGR